MSVSKILINSFMLMGMALVSLGFSATSHAGKKNIGPFNAAQGARVTLQPGLEAKEPTRLSFPPDYSFTGGIELPVQRDMAADESVVLSNTRAGDKAEAAELLIERSAKGGLLIRLINYQGFNYQACTGGDKPPPGIAHGEGPGETCFQYGLRVTLPGQFQGTLAKLSIDQGLEITTVQGKLGYRLSSEDNNHPIEADEVLMLRLAAGSSVTLKVVAAAEHKTLSPTGKVLYHLAEQKKTGPALGQVAVVGQLSFTAKFDVGPQGDSNFQRELRAGDKIRVKGGEANENFAFIATQSNDGSLLEISRISEERPLRSIQVNEEGWITLEDNSTVAIASAGGAAGYQISDDTAPYGLADGNTSIVQAGEVATIELFTTVKGGGMGYQVQPKKPGFDGPAVIGVPHFDPKPTDDPQPSAEPQDDGAAGEKGSNKDVVPGDGVIPSASGSGWGSCSLSATSNAVSGWNVAWLLMALPLLRRRK